MQDSEIITLYFARNEDAIQETSDKYGNALLHISTNITNDIPDAEECVNDTYLTAWNSIPPERPLHFFAWLARTVRNFSCKVVELRTRKKRSAVMIELSNELEECLPSGNDIQKECESKELREVIDAFIYELDEDSQAVFMRRYFYTDSIGEISHIMGFSESKIKSMLHRMRIKLKEKLEKEGFSI